MSHTKVKICGLFRPEDISAANQAQPDYIGFVFAKSRRQVSPQQAEMLRAKLSPDIVPIGVFVNAPISHVLSLLEAHIIDGAQLHGDEEESYIETLKARTAKPIIKAVCVKSHQDILSWQKTRADFLLLDYGAGEGKTFDWSLTARCNRPYFLAGGICADNLPYALERSPYGVDVSSGVETLGYKDPQKIAAFVKTVRQF